MFGIHIGDNLLRSQTELSFVPNVSIGGAHQVNSQLFIPFSEREKGPIQTMLMSSGADGLDSLCHSIGTVANERVSALDSGTTLVSKTPPQQKSDSIITLHVRSPLLERPLIS